MLRSTSLIVQRYVLGRQTLLIPIRGLDLELRVPSRDPAGRQIYRDGVHAPLITDFLATHLELRPDELVFDLGASVGWYTLLLSRIAPRGVEIHAFEPDPWVCGLLQENVSRNRAGMVTVVPAAVGAAQGTAMLYRYGSRRRQRSGWLPAARGDSMEVPMVRLDDYCRDNALNRRPVGLVKIGLQGFEYYALQGARETLARCRAVLMEFAPRQQEEADLHPANVLDLLVELGFSPAVIGTRGLRPVERGELLADAMPRHVFWRRGDARRAAPAPDPDALAI
jgi:FkbM family methyltransferase